MHGQMSAPTWKRLIIAGVLVLVCALVGLLAFLNLLQHFIVFEENPDTGRAPERKSESSRWSRSAALS